MKLANTKMDLGGSLVNSATFTHENSASFNLEGDWIDTGTFIPNDGSVYFSGTATQNINIQDITSASFYNFIVSKNSNSIVLANSNSITIDGELSFNSTTHGYINSRNNGLVTVSSSNISRNGFGHVDGELALFFDDGELPVRTFVIGNGDDYTPVLIDINNSGTLPGEAGYLAMISNDRFIEMIGSQLEANQNVERQYELNDFDQNFDMGSRTYSMVINYINPTDLRNGSDPNEFRTARYTGSTNLWANFLLGEGVTTVSSVESFGNASSGTFVVGPEDFFLEMYTRSSGSFSTPENWSLYGYGLKESGFAPRSRDVPFIGDGDRIQLYEDISILDRRTLTVEQAGPSNESGTFIMGENILSGTGTFTLLSGGWLGFGDEAGLTLASNEGNIQTAERNYNPANHNNGSFVFTGSNSSTVGNGFPSDIANLYVEGTNELFILQNTNINDDLVINSGILDIQEFDIDGQNSGSFSIADNARLRIGGENNLLSSLLDFTSYLVDEASYIVFNGTDQVVSEFPANFNTTLGYGNLIATGDGTKSVENNMLIRGNLLIQDAAIFENQVGVTDLRVYRNVLNQNSGLNNYGKIIIGQN